MSLSNVFSNVFSNNNNKRNNNTPKYYKPSPLSGSTSATATASKYFPSSLTKKKEPKKEFSILSQSTSFPILATSSDKSQNAHVTRVKMSFANAAKQQDLEKQPDQQQQEKTQPGWIHIRNNNGKIEYKNGAQTERYPCSDDNFEVRLGNIMFKNRLAKEQYERDNDIFRLGDLSEFYGEKTVFEIYADEERRIYKSNSNKFTDNDNDNASSSSDSDYDDYINYNKFENRLQ